SYGSPNISKSIPLSVTLDSSNKIIACVALAKMTDNIWSRIPGTNWDIQYSGGKIGVGTATPQASLDVAAGSIRPGSLASAGPCGANNEGAIAYDQTTHTPVFCNGTSWSGMFHSFGGMWINYSKWDKGCAGDYSGEAYSVNPFTGTTSCPDGFTDTVLNPMSCSRIHFCWK
ncbi:MAG TPA: hypothetical protein VIG33_06635, partial [Pseudobdellovibrionaceae bacterium]